MGSSREFYQYFERCRSSDGSKVMSNSFLVSLLSPSSALPAPAITRSHGNCCHFAKNQLQIKNQGFLDISSSREFYQYFERRRSSDGSKVMSNSFLVSLLSPSSALPAPAITRSHGNCFHFAKNQLQIKNQGFLNISLSREFYQQFERCRSSDGSKVMSNSFQ